MKKKKTTTKSTQKATPQSVKTFVTRLLRKSESQTLDQAIVRTAVELHFASDSENAIANYAKLFMNAIVNPANASFALIAEGPQVLLRLPDGDEEADADALVSASENRDTESSSVPQEGAGESPSSVPPPSVMPNHAPMPVHANHTLTGSMPISMQPPGSVGDSEALALDQAVVAAHSSINVTLAVALEMFNQFGNRISIQNVIITTLNRLNHSVPRVQISRDLLELRNQGYFIIDVASKTLVRQASA